MNKQNWLENAIDYIDSLDTHEFECFLLDCVPPQFFIETNFDEIILGKFISISMNESANMDSYYSDNISIAA